MHNNSLFIEPLAPLSFFWRWTYSILAFLLVAFGQPAWVPLFGLAAACFGYTLFWRVLLDIKIPSQRFWLSFIWLFCVQLVQLSWFVSHPFLYIYAVYLFVASLFGGQFGLLGLFINPRMINSVWRILTLACLWTILEWSRLFILSGFSFNPFGIALGGNLYSLQMASLWGVFGLSFWIILTNLLALRAWVTPAKFLNTSLWLAAALVPYVFGFVHIHKHESAMLTQSEGQPSSFNAMLIQTAFPVEESMDFNTKKNMIKYVSEEWQKILTISKPHLGKPLDLIALPEFVVPFGTYAHVYAFEDVVAIFKETLGSENIKALPSPEWPIGGMISQNGNEKLMVTNAFWAQSIANIFDARVIAGLEDADDVPGRGREYYSAAILFHPQRSSDKIINDIPEEKFQFPQRYEKRVLVPMGEYIPFAFCRELAQKYGVFGSFTAGTEAKVMDCGQAKISPSICYEETYGDLVREGRQKGADTLVNLTSDVWYPNSRLPKQHFEHARFRTVENGTPLLRACNTGVTAAIDSLGRSVAVLGEENPEKVEWVADALYVKVPNYNYKTLYSQFGDKLIVGFSLLVILISVFYRKFSF